MKCSLSYIFIILSVLLSSCSCSSSHEEGKEILSFIDLHGSEWNQEEMIWFEPLELDSTIVTNRDYTVQLIFRSSRRNAPIELPVAIEIERLDGKVEHDTVCIGTDDSRHLSATQTQYGVTEYSVTLARPIRIEEGISIGLKTLGAPEEAHGLLNIGLKLRPSI